MHYGRVHTAVHVHTCSSVSTCDSGVGERRPWEVWARSLPPAGAHDCEDPDVVDDEEMLPSRLVCRDDTSWPPPLPSPTLAASAGDADDATEEESLSEEETVVTVAESAESSDAEPEPLDCCSVTKQLVARLPSPPAVEL